MKKLIMLLCSASILVQAAAYEPSILKGLRWGVSERQGKRPSMEDAYTATSSKSENTWFFGIYDGHGGADVAHIVASGEKESGTQPLHQCLDIDKLRSNPQAEFERTYHQMDESSAIKNYPTQGTTAITAVIQRDQQKAYLAWAGDARAILVKNDGSVPFATIDHKPDSPAERARIEAADNRIYFFGVWRVNGLAVSRSIGDRDIKGDNAIIATPEVKVIDLSPDDRFLILACDGIWDVLSNEEAAKIVSNVLNGASSPSKSALENEVFKENGNNQLAINAARALRDAAYNNGSRDNLSVLVIEW